MAGTLRNTRIRIMPIDVSEYELSIEIGDSWVLKEVVNQEALDALREEMNNAMGLSYIIQKFKCKEEDARKIRDFWLEKPNAEDWERYEKVKRGDSSSYWGYREYGYDICRRDCPSEDCYNCVINCQSPLERQMLLELNRNGITTILQRRINKDGSYYDAPREVDSDNILTIPDFYIEKDDIKVCIYADGHTYHERTEYQAQRDRNIDRELQRLGYKVLRYTGNEIRENCDKVIENIKENLTVQETRPANIPETNGGKLF